MAAINPARLNEQIDDLLEYLDQPAAFRRKCLDILDFYADRTRRPTAKSAADDTPRAFRVPRPVLRAMGVRLKSSAQDDPELARLASSSLWEAGYRETRLLASAILSGQRHSLIGEWVIEWITTCDDRIAVADIARVGIQGWRKEDEKEFLDKCAEWIQSPKRSIRVFCLLALDAAVSDPGFSGLPAVFRMLVGKAASAQRDEKRALLQLVRMLADRSPLEATRFLLDEVKHHNGGVKAFIRALIDQLPHKQRKLLEQALSS